MSAAIFKLDRDRNLLKADVTWTYPVDLKYVEPGQKHVNKCEQRIIPEQNAIILLNYVMHGIQPHQFEPDGTWQKEDDSNGSEINVQEKL